MCESHSCSFNAAVGAATRSLDSNTRLRAVAGEGGGGDVLAASFSTRPSRQYSRETSRIETTLARAIKKKAIRVMDLFQDWDEDRDGLITKKELRTALQGSGLGASTEEIDALFSKWDADQSGAIDYNELNRALKKRMTMMRDEVGRDGGGGGGGGSAGGGGGGEGEGAAEEREIHLLGAGHRAAVRQQKEWKEAAKASRTALSPRSKQLKEAAERAEAQRREEQEKVWREEEETGRRWTAAKWLASRKVAQVVANALQLPALTADGASQFSYVKGLSRAKVEGLLQGAGLGGLVDFLAESVASLGGQETGSAEQLNEKFATTAKFQMTYGSLSLFYGGLESLLGPPKMYRGAEHAERSLFNMMEFEHCHDKDTKVEFRSPNGTTTTSATGGRSCARPTRAWSTPSAPATANGTRSGAASRSRSRRCSR